MNVRELIQRSGRRQGAVALELGITEGHFSEMVNGKKLFPISKLRQLAGIVAVSLDDLLDALDINGENRNV